jgi:hypothetical protein
MPANQIQGTVTFIHHDKDYATIDYELNGKKKSINALIGELIQQRWKAEKIIKKVHHFRIGDAVSFIIVPSQRGDKMVADCVTFLYNNALTNMLQKAVIDNKFVGYLKEVEGKYFVKETASYISFPLLISPWEASPPAGFVNEPVFFQLDNFESADKVSASLCRHQFIPEYIKAMLHFKNQTAIKATVTIIKPHAVWVNMFNEKITAKLKIVASDRQEKTYIIGNAIEVIISYLSPFKIVIEQV